MQTNDEKNTPDTSKMHQQEQENPPGYPLYPPSEDIYNQSEKEEVPEFQGGSTKAPDANNEKGPDGDSYGGDLDVPGSELDDDQEIIGNEDEENNYYSLGGDNHESLEEDQGDE